MEPFFALVVSADPGPLSVTHKVLEEHGVNVKVVASAQAAEQAIKTTKFDLGIFDHDLPGVLDLARGHESLNPKMVFALLRGAQVREVRGKRIHFIVQKPFT